MRTIALIPLALVASCGVAADQPPPTVPPPPPCPITSSSDWVATIDAMPGADGPKLVVTGKVSVPGPDWTPRWAGFMALESDPVQLVLQLDADLRPQGVSRDAVVKDVRGSWPMRDPVRSVTVTCRGTVLARIAPVRTAR